MKNNILVKLLPAIAVLLLLGVSFITLVILHPEHKVELWGLACFPLIGILILFIFRIVKPVKNIMEFN